MRIPVRIEYHFAQPAVKIPVPIVKALQYARGSFVKRNKVFANAFGKLFRRNVTFSRSMPGTSHSKGPSERIGQHMDRHCERDSIVLLTGVERVSKRKLGPVCVESVGEFLDLFGIRFSSKEVFLLHFQKVVSSHVFDESVKGPDIGYLRNARIIEVDEGLVIDKKVPAARLALKLLDF